jgi:adenylylsulfate kinase
MGQMKKHSFIPGTIWITGLTASGKTTLGKHLYDNLLQIGIDNVEFFDGEQLRKHLDRKYGYSLEERFAVLENIIEIASKCNDRGKISIVSTISHKRKMRELARKRIAHFMEVYLECPVAICAQRDYKGHYKKAFAGEYEMFVGVTDPYELSERVELILDTASIPVEHSSQILFDQALKFLVNKAAKL